MSLHIIYCTVTSEMTKIYLKIVTLVKVKWKQICTKYTCTTVE